MTLKNLVVQSPLLSKKRNGIMCFERSRVEWSWGTDISLVSCHILDIFYLDLEQNGRGSNSDRGVAPWCNALCHSRSNLGAKNLRNGVSSIC